MHNNIFQITEEIVSNVSFIKVENTKTQEHFRLIPEYGGRLSELYLKNETGLHKILRKVERIDSNNADDIFTNAKLSPFANRIENGKYNFNGKSFALPIMFPEENNSCHGFLYAKKFNVSNKEINNESASCSLSYKYDNEDEGYPFTYEIDLTYKLTLNDGLICTTRIKNLSTSAIPISDGWHHYFDLDVIVDNLMMKLDVLKVIEVNDKKIPTGISKPYEKFSKPELINKMNFDTCFLVNPNAGKSFTQLIDERNKINLTIWQETGKNKFNYLNVYIPSDRKSIAIEPMTSNINAFNNREGLIILNPYEEFNASIGFHL